MSLLANRGMANSMPDLGASGMSWNGRTGAVAGGTMLSDAESEFPLRPIETPHQKLQRSLQERRRGGPIEQTQSPPQRLRNIRSTEILHSSLEEPLSTYKSLEPVRPRWPAHWRRYHLCHGIRVKDQDTILVEANDMHVKTKKGLIRDSSGFVTYSETHRRKAEIDVMFLAQILNGGIPGGGHAWTPRKLERIFKERTGRGGTWSHYEVPLKHFLTLFPKTFEQFGPDMQFVRLRHMLKPQLMDNVQDAMARLACARERGFIEPQPHIEGTVGLHNEGLREMFEAIDESRPGSPTLAELKDNLRAKMPDLPELRNNRMKVAFKPNTPITQLSRASTPYTKPNTR